MEDILERYLQELASKIERKIGDPSVEVKVTDKGLAIFAEEGSIHSDQGVDGTRKKHNTPSKYNLGTRFTYKNKMPPSKDLASWAKKKGLSLKNGQTYEGLGYALSKSIFKKGIKPSLYLTKPFVDMLDKEDFEGWMDELIKELES